MKSRIANQWATFAERVLPAAAGGVQKQETRRAFYAGAEALMRVLFRDFEPGTEATDGDLDLMREIDQEIRDFARDVVEGRA